MKPGVFTQMYVQLVFAVANKQALLRQDFRKDVFKYISGIIKNKKCKSIIVNGVLDHVHILFGLHHTMSVSEIARDVKRSSSIFIRENKFTPFKFAWQEGYGAFTYSRSQIENVYKYIENQENHHKKKTFKQEYIEFLEKYEIEYDEKFLFNFFDL
jgi:REP element-mobilizing transposase RayT